MIKTVLSATIEACTNMMIDKPFVGGSKVVVEISGITENLFDFGNIGFSRRKTMEGDFNCCMGGKMINSS